MKHVKDGIRGKRQRTEYKVKKNKDSASVVLEKLKVEHQRCKKDKDYNLF